MTTVTQAVEKRETGPMTVMWQRETPATEAKRNAGDHS